MNKINEIRKRFKYNKQYLVEDHSADLETLLHDSEIMLAKIAELKVDIQIWKRDNIELSTYITKLEAKLKQVEIETHKWKKGNGLLYAARIITALKDKADE